MQWTQWDQGKSLVDFEDLLPVEGFELQNEDLRDFVFKEQILAF